MSVRMKMAIMVSKHPSVSQFIHSDITDSFYAGGLIDASHLSHEALFDELLSLQIWKKAFLLLSYYNNFSNCNVSILYIVE